MSFLDKSSLVVDAVLTKLGRERLSQNNFVVAKFALGDDEVDYKLYNESNTQGPNNYGIVIENMPIHQAFLSTDLALKYKLVNRNKVYLKMVFIFKNRFNFFKNTLEPLTFRNNIFIFIKDNLSYYVFFFFEKYLSKSFICY